MKLPIIKFWGSPGVRKRFRDVPEVFPVSERQRRVSNLWFEILLLCYANVKEYKGNAIVSKILFPNPLSWVLTVRGVNLRVGTNVSELLVQFLR